MAGRVLLKIVYLLVRRILGLVVLLFRGDMAKDAELLVLRHENAVLRRHAGKVWYEPADRVWFAALARLGGDRRTRACRWAGLCWREGGSRLPPTLVLRKRSCGPAPAGPPVRRVAARIAGRLEQARAGCEGRCPGLSGVRANTKATQARGSRRRSTRE